MTTPQQPPAELAVPKFIKVNQIQPGGHGYNTYVKVVAVDTAPSDAYRVSCVVADETGSARASFIDKAKDLIKLGDVLAIRNGKADVIKEQIQLRIDVFGRLTKETVNIDAVGYKDRINISDKKWEKQLPERGRGGRGRNNRYGDDRGEDRPRGQGRRGYDRDRRDNRDYRDNREGGRRNYDNRGGYDRRDRDRDYDRRDRNRDYDRGYDRKDRDRDYDRRDNRDTRGDRGYGERRERRGGDYDRGYDRRDDRGYDRRDNRDYRRQERGGQRTSDYSRRDNRPTRQQQREER